MPQVLAVIRRAFREELVKVVRPFLPPYVKYLAHHRTTWASRKKNPGQISFRG